MAKEVLWKGMTKEQVDQLDQAAFLSLVSSRARRSLKRARTPLQEALLKRLRAGDTSPKTHARDMVIIREMVGKTIKVYTGKDFVSLTITLDMLGHYLGEFALTRKIVSHSAAGVGATRSSKAVSAR